MALTLPIDTTTCLELDEYLELIDRCVDPDDFDALAESAVFLKQLANNRRFLITHVNNSLLNSRSDHSNAVGDTAFCLARRGPVCVRANVWVPPSDVAASLRWQANIAAYLTPHDHPFSFVTVGYLGPGYETTIFQYERSRITGRIGENVELQFLEKTSLPEGKVMVYRACRDVHFQAHPEKFSISLNYMVFPRETRDQYGFDIKGSRIVDTAMNSRRAHMQLCKLAAVLGDSKTSNVLEEVARTSWDEEIRLSAFTAWSYLDKDRAEEIWSAALSDPHDHVNARARSELQCISQG
jgi:hypothetical protein